MMSYKALVSIILNNFIRQRFISQEQGCIPIFTITLNIISFVISLKSVRKKSQQLKKRVFLNNYNFYMHILMKQQPFHNNYWCHDCKIEFVSRSMPGQQVIECPKCRGDFCELKNNNPNLRFFQPFQKKPEKKKCNQLHLERRAMPINVHQLHQVLEEQNHQKQGIQLSKQELEGYAKQLATDSQCSVCREDLKKGEKHPIFHCRHAFHLQCLIDWLKIKNSCPTCRHIMIDK